MRQPPRAVHTEIVFGNAKYGCPQLIEGDWIIRADDAVWFDGDHPVPAGPELDHGDEATFAPLQEKRLLGRVDQFDLAGQARHGGIGAGKPDSGEFADGASPAIACHQVAAGQRRRPLRCIDYDINTGGVLVESRHSGGPLHLDAQLGGDVLENLFGLGLHDVERVGDRVGRFE
jgi:hypothetical protein